MSFTIKKFRDIDNYKEKTGQVILELIVNHFQFGVAN
jgi:hypothetical protein